MKFGKLSRDFDGWPIGSSLTARLDYKGLKRHLRHATLDAHVSAEFEHELVAMVAEVDSTFVAFHASLLAALDALAPASPSAGAGSAAGSPVAGVPRVSSTTALPSPPRLTSALRPRSRFELAQSALLLRSYALLQYVSVLKIVKKHDKLLLAGARAATRSASRSPPNGSPRLGACPHGDEAFGAARATSAAPAPLRARAVRLLASSRFVRALRYDALFAALARSTADAGAAGDALLRVDSWTALRDAAARSRAQGAPDDDDDAARPPSAGSGAIPIAAAAGGPRRRARFAPLALGARAHTADACAYDSADDDDAAAAELDDRLRAPRADERADGALEASVSEELAALLNEGFEKYELAAIFAEAHVPSLAKDARMGGFGADRPRSNSGTQSVPLPSPLSRHGRYSRNRASARRAEAFDDDEPGGLGLLSDAESEAACGPFGRLELELDERGASGADAADAPSALWAAPTAAVASALCYSSSARVEYKRAVRIA